MPYPVIELRNVYALECYAVLGAEMQHGISVGVGSSVGQDELGFRAGQSRNVDVIDAELEIGNDVFAVTKAGKVEHVRPLIALDSTSTVVVG